MQLMVRALSRAFARDGRIIEAKSEMMANTTRSSIMVKDFLIGWPP